MEIERKWLTAGWPQGHSPVCEIRMRQGYIALHPTVRIRSEQTGEETRYILCFKGEGGLAREEIETPVSAALFTRLEAFIAKPLIEKIQRRYALSGGLVLEANRVDAGLPGEFWYAEVEFDTVEQARAWRPAPSLAGYLAREVTGQAGQSMGAYWQATRL